MKTPWRTGFSFGLTSGIITTLGLMIGLNSGTHSKLAVVGGIIAIAITDALSDAIAMHVAEESTGDKNSLSIWHATFATFITKFGFSTIFVVPVLLLPLNTAIIFSIVFGLFALSVLCYFVALGEHEKPWKVVVEHLLIATIVIITTHFTGRWINNILG